MIFVTDDLNCILVHVFCTTSTYIVNGQRYLPVADWHNNCAQGLRRIIAQCYKSKQVHFPLLCPRSLSSSSSVTVTVLPLSLYLSLSCSRRP
jgi:hypothetical protein